MQAVRQRQHAQCLALRRIIENALAIRTDAESRHVARSFGKRFYRRAGTQVPELDIEILGGGDELVLGSKLQGSDPCTMIGQLELKLATGVPNADFPVFSAGGAERAILV